jgi:hypothetical protein
MRPTERSFYLGVIAVLSLLIFLQRSCTKAPKCQLTHCDEAGSFIESNGIVTDTVYLDKKDSSAWKVPKPASSSKQAQFQLPAGLADSFLHSLPQSVQNASKTASRDSLALADYWNSRIFIDSSNVEGGQVIVESMVSANRLAAQRVLTNIKEKTVTVEKTVTKVIREAPRNQLYAGIIAQGMKSDVLTGFGGQLMWKSKRDKVWTASVIYGRNGSVIYQAGALFKLSFRR